MSTQWNCTILNSTPWNCTQINASDPKSRWTADSGWRLATIILTVNGLLTSPFWVEHCKRVFRWARVRLLKWEGKCEVLQWSTDIVTRSESMHTCNFYFCRCDVAHRGKHETCYEVVLQAMFTKAWNSALRRYVRSENKPKCLEPGKKYLCTDVDTILAFVLCSASGPKGKFKGTDKFNTMSFGEDTSVEMKEYEHELLVVHLKGRFRPERADLEATEMENLLRGHPPWYRKKCKTKWGGELYYQIEDHSDLLRAGWVMALGMSDKPEKKAFPLYIVHPQVRKSSEVPEGGRYMIEAIDRVRDVLKNKFLVNGAFYGDKSVGDAMRMVDDAKVPSEPRVTKIKPRPGTAELINGKMCKTVIKVFNDYEHPLTAAEVAELRPVLDLVLQAAIDGARIITRYLKDLGMELEIPLLLQKYDNKDRNVYLRGCDEDSTSLKYD